ncbi:hypothetical protein [Flavimobilis soli]|nr:hypothetical protein [Flavimobilis soli]
MSYQLPTEPDDSIASRRLLGALISGVPLSGLVAIVYGAVYGTSHADSALLVIASVWCAAYGQAAFVISLAWYTRKGAYGEAMNARLLYGCSAFLFTLFVTVLDAPPSMYLVANGAAYLAALLFIGRRHGRMVVTLVLDAWPLLAIGLSGLWNARRLVVGLTFGTLASQAGGMIAPALGWMAGPWSAAMRIVSGFQTLGWQTIGTKLDIWVARAVRDKDAIRVGRSIRNSTVVGLAISVVGALVALAFAFFALETDRSIRELTILATAVALFALGNIALATVGRVLAFLGRDRARFVWEAARLLATLAVVLLGGPSFTLLGLAIVVMLSYLVHAALVRQAIREMIS